MSMNVNYIRAAIEARTGIRLSLKQTVQYLLEEKMITKTQATKALFPGYQTLFPAITKEHAGEIGNGSMLMPVDALLANTQNIYSTESKQAWTDN